VNPEIKDLVIFHAHYQVNKRLSESLLNLLERAMLSHNIFKASVLPELFFVLILGALGE